METGNMINMTNAGATGGSCARTEKSDTIYARFKVQVCRWGDAPAVIEDGRRVSFRELDMMADGILSGFAGERHSFVGIVMSHGAEMIAAMLAVLKSGAAYIPAEPSLPAARREYMMSSAGVRLIITDSYCRKALAAAGKSPAADYPDMSAPDGPAYVLYTSGTTGKPKGVIVENRNVVNYAEAFEAEFHAGRGDVMLQYSVCSFDIFVEEVFATLLNGAALAIPSQGVCRGGVGELYGFMERHGVTMVSGFPYLLAEMNNRLPLPSSLRLLISGGDVLRASYIDRLCHRGVMIYNTYGPSETTVCASYYRCDNAEALPDGTYPVGRPVRGVEIRILDGSGDEAAPGATGEICIYGRGVSRGYLGNPPEQSNFVTQPDGERMYRSGDLGYILPDGNIAFLGRRDDQVMIYGKRVEPGEVENVLNESPDVERGVVRSFLDDRGLAYLVAYFVPRDAGTSLRSVKRWLKSKLTDFMVPEHFVKLEAIPLTERGKVDTRALPRIER